MVSFIQNQAIEMQPNNLHHFTTHNNNHHHHSHMHPHQTHHAPHQHQHQHTNYQLAAQSYALSNNSSPSYFESNSSSGAQDTDANQSNTNLEYYTINNNNKNNNNGDPSEANASPSTTYLSVKRCKSNTSVPSASTNESEIIGIMRNTKNLNGNDDQLNQEVNKNIDLMNNNSTINYQAHNHHNHHHHNHHNQNEYMRYENKIFYGENSSLVNGQSLNHLNIIQQQNNLYQQTSNDIDFNNQQQQQILNFQYQQQHQTAALLNNNNRINSTCPHNYYTSQQQAPITPSTANSYINLNDMKANHFDFSVSSTSNTPCSVSSSSSTSTPSSILPISNSCIQLNDGNNGLQINGANCINKKEVKSSSDGDSNEEYDEDDEEDEDDDDNEDDDFDDDDEGDEGDENEFAISTIGKNSNQKIKKAKIIDNDNENDYEIKYNCLTEEGAHMNTLFNSPSSMSSSSMPNKTNQNNQKCLSINQDVKANKTEKSAENQSNKKSPKTGKASKNPTSGKHRLIVTKTEMMDDSDQQLIALSQNNSSFQDPAVAYNLQLKAIMINNYKSAGIMDDFNLVNLPLRELNKRLRALPKQVAYQMKKRRRTLKNRKYAQNCRSKRLEQKSEMEIQNLHLKAELEKLRKIVDKLQNENNNLVKLTSINHSVIMNASSTSITKDINNESTNKTKPMISNSSQSLNCIDTYNSHQLTQLLSSPIINKHNDSTLIGQVASNSQNAMNNNNSMLVSNTYI